MKKKLVLAFSIIGAVVFVSMILGVIRFAVASKKNLNTTYVVKKEIVQNVISVAGVVHAAHEQTLQALSSGTVMNVYVQQGDEVKKGDVLIQLDETTQLYNLARHDYDMETTRISGSRKELALKETERLSLLQKISERKVTATFDGIIAAMDVNVGDSLEAKDSVGSIVDVSYLTAEVEVAETDVAKLKIGQEVEFTFPSYSGTVKGYVTGWPKIGEVTSRGATVVKVQLRIDEYPESILPNFSFSGKIKVKDDDEYILVERYAIGRENKQAFVVKQKNFGHGSEKIEVNVRPFSSDYVRILSGDVSEGDVLLQQTQPKSSGWNRNNRSGKNGMPGVPGVMPMGRK